MLSSYNKSNKLLEILLQRFRNVLCCGHSVDTIPGITLIVSLSGQTNPITLYRIHQQCIRRMRQATMRQKGGSSES